MHKWQKCSLKMNIPPRTVTDTYMQVTSLIIFFEDCPFNLVLPTPHGCIPSNKWSLIPNMVIFIQSFANAQKSRGGGGGVFFVLALANKDVQSHQVESFSVQHVNHRNWGE